MQTAYNLLQFEVLSCAFPAILKDTTKRNVVNYLWHINPCLTLRGFVDAHSDPSCLLRIVDVCHDLKVCIDTVTLTVVQVIVATSLVLILFLEVRGNIGLFTTTTNSKLFLKKETINVAGVPCTMITPYTSDIEYFVIGSLAPFETVML